MPGSRAVRKYSELCPYTYVEEKYLVGVGLDTHNI
jgi:hypothetical protein